MAMRAPGVSGADARRIRRPCGGGGGGRKGHGKAHRCRRGDARAEKDLKLWVRKRECRSMCFDSTELRLADSSKHDGQTRSHAFMSHRN